MSKWDSPADEGATGKTFEIRTIADFLKVPEDRRRICLREFHVWLSAPEHLIDLFVAVGKGAISRDAIACERDVFVWHDDGKATATIEIHPQASR